MLDMAGAKHKLKVNDHLHMVYGLDTRSWWTFII
jgi:hypothetical protein